MKNKVTKDTKKKELVIGVHFIQEPLQTATILVGMVPKSLELMTLFVQNAS